MFPWFPYTNFHRLNADWILKQVKECVETVNNAVSGIPAMQEDINRISNVLNEHIPESARQFASIDRAITGLNEAFTDLQSSLETFEGSTADSIGLLNNRLNALESSRVKGFYAELPFNGSPQTVPESQQAALALAHNAIQEGQGILYARITQNVIQSLPNAFTVGISSAAGRYLYGSFTQLSTNPDPTQQGMVTSTAFIIIDIGSNTIPATFEIAVQEGAAT